LLRFSQVRGSGQSRHCPNNCGQTIQNGQRATLAAKETSSVKLLRFPQVKAKVGLSRSEIARREEAGDFPRRRTLGKRSCAWVDEEIDQWILERKVQMVGSGKQIEGCPKAMRAS